MSRCCWFPDQPALWYRLTGLQEAQVAAADLLVWTGPELEPFMTAAVAGVTDDKRVVELLNLPPENSSRSD